MVLACVRAERRCCRRRAALQPAPAAARPTELSHAFTFTGPCRTKVIYAESLSNPTLVVADVPGLAALARARGIRLVVDNTFT